MSSKIILTPYNIYTCSVYGSFNQPIDIYELFEKGIVANDVSQEDYADFPVRGIQISYKKHNNETKREASRNIKTKGDSYYRKKKPQRLFLNSLQLILKLSNIKAHIVKVKIFSNSLQFQHVLNEEEANIVAQILQQYITIILQPKNPYIIEKLRISLRNSNFRIVRQCENTYKNISIMRKRMFSILSSEGYNVFYDTLVHQAVVIKFRSIVKENSYISHVNIYSSGKCICGAQTEEDIKNTISLLDDILQIHGNLFVV
jgi:hypothetical protein